MSEDPKVFEADIDPNFTCHSIHGRSVDVHM